MSTPKHGHTAPHGSNPGIPAPIPGLSTHNWHGSGREPSLSAPHLANNGGATVPSRSQAGPLSRPRDMESSWRYDRLQPPPQHSKWLHSQDPDPSQYPYYSGMSSFGCPPYAQASMHAMYPPYTSYGYGPHPSVPYAPHLAGHGPYPRYVDPYYAPYHSPHTAPLPVPDAPPHLPIRYSVSISQQSINFQQTHLTNPAHHNTAPPQHANPSNFPLNHHQRKFSETSNTPSSSTDFQSSLNQLPRKIQVAVNHVANVEAPAAAAKQISHIAKNLAALAVMKRGKNAKFRTKKRLGVESTDSESEPSEDTATDFDNRRKGGQDNSPTLKHKCRTANCTRNFATLRLLRKHQTTKHPECFESKMSTPISQNASLTPKGSRKKRKLSVEVDEIQNSGTPKNDASTKPTPTLELTPTLNESSNIEPKTVESGAQISAKSEPDLKEHKRIAVNQAVVVLGRGGDSDDEDLNDDE
ncbi:hypothetical protein BJ741DRAFT_710964 [Chytriomyces cf. hyalinus JEL632]|nr:hypothetical protein BJ741DRAFT_710964 [Chytriomyces cf. hyalinus JEL632]